MNRKSLFVRLVIVATLVWSSGAALAEEAPPNLRKVRLTTVSTDGPMPGDLVSPEGKTRWDLTTVPPRATVTRITSRDGERLTVETLGAPAPAPAGVTATASSTRAVYTDPAGGDAALRFLFPDRYDEMRRTGSIETLIVEERTGDRVDTLWIEIDVLGPGWVHLPSRPYEAALQRVLILRKADGARGYSPDRLVHRWVSPLAGVVAEVSGPVAADGSARVSVDEASTLDEVIVGGASLKIYVDQLWESPFNSINYGFDKGSGTPISSLTPDQDNTIGDMIARSQWDFSGVTSGTEMAVTVAPINAMETCNTASCGYTGGGQLDRMDFDFDNTADLIKNNQVTELETGLPHTTIWLRAGSQKEGVAGSFGTGESRFCYDPTFDATTRSDVPLWSFTHQDADGWYMQAGDSWSSPEFMCEQNLFNQLCGASQFLDELYSYKCDEHSGTHYVEVLKEGVVTIPSGHTLNTLLARNVADFCVNTGASCFSFFKVDEVLTVVYIWEVPYWGSVALLQSEQDAPDLTSFTTVASTEIKFGLYPPRTIAAPSVTANSVTVSWDPGLITSRIDSYKVYWDTDSGASTPYAFDSVSNSGQVVFNGTEATISGLSAGTTYFFTVTSVSDFTDPSSGVTTTYESPVYPTQVFGNPSFTYPIEVQATTTGGACTPTTEVTNLMMSKVLGGVEACWDPVADACLTGYRILGADTPNPDTAFSPIVDTGVGTCVSFDPTETFFLVVAQGTGGEGPWGHFSK